MNIYFDMWRWMDALEFRKEFKSQTFSYLICVYEKKGKSGTKMTKQSNERLLQAKKQYGIVDGSNGTNVNWCFIFTEYSEQ